MVSYEEAKKIAFELLGDLSTKINEALEVEDAYIFDDNENTYAGRIPIVIRKSDGMALNCWQFMQQKNISFEDMKKIQL